jgi:hypothetical protein
MRDNLTISAPGLVQIDQLKQARLLDILRRVIANPENAKSVAETLSRDWFPMLHIDATGKVKIEP